MEESKEPLTLALQEIKGVFEAKTDVRKGYCQDLLSARGGTCKKGIPI